MASEDRDHLFEKALARQMHADAGGASVCLDAEKLAAYHERLLSPEETLEAKNHLVSCSRCQQILTQLEATENVGASSQTREEDAVLAAAVWEPKRTETLPDVASAAATIQTANETKSTVAQFPAKRSALLRWAAPVGAIA